MKKIFTLVFALLLLHLSYGTIHYVTVDESVNNAPRSYDLDLDGDNDFTFEYFSNPYADSILCLKPTSFFAADGVNAPKAYQGGAGFGTYHWQSGGGLVCNGGGQTGNFASAYKYLMVKFSDGTHTFYGWFYLNTTFGYLIIESYAWQDVPDQTITAGETGGTGIVETVNASSAISALSANHISFENCKGFDQVAVYNVEGKMLSEIIAPVASHNYALDEKGILIIGFFKRGKLVGSGKYAVTD